jgi:hypothetical protein
MVGAPGRGAGGAAFSIHETDASCSGGARRSGMEKDLAASPPPNEPARPVPARIPINSPAPGESMSRRRDTFPHDSAPIAPSPPAKHRGESRCVGANVEPGLRRHRPTQRAHLPTRVATAPAARRVVAVDVTVLDLVALDASLTVRPPDQGLDDGSHERDLAPHRGQAGGHAGGGRRPR